MPSAARFDNSRLSSAECEVLHADHTDAWKRSDMVMMASTGGAERTAREFASLLARAGLTMTRVLATTTSASIVEARPASMAPTDSS